MEKDQKKCFMVLNLQNRIYMKKQKRKQIFIGLTVVIFVIAIIFFGFSAYKKYIKDGAKIIPPVVQDKTETDKKVVCPSDTKNCPDGFHYVERTEEGCEFAKCPVITKDQCAWKLTKINEVYSLCGNVLVWSDQGLGEPKQNLTILDPKTFVYIGGGYFKDFKNVYSTQPGPIGIVDGLKPEDISMLPNGKFQPTGGECYFIKKLNIIVVACDYDNGFATEAEFKGIDLGTFKYFENYAEDQNSVFYIGDGMNGVYVQKIDGADPKTFKYLVKNQGDYFSDKNNVYLGSTQLKDANPNDLSFKKFGDFNLEFAISNGNVYDGAKKLKGLNPNNVIVKQNGAILCSGSICWYMRCVNDGFWYVPESEIKDPQNYNVNSDSECQFFLDQIKNRK